MNTKTLAFAKEIIRNSGLPEEEFIRLAELIRNKELSINAFLNSRHLHYLNPYLKRQEILDFLLSAGYSKESDLIKKDFPQAWLVDKNSGEKIRKLEYWEFDESWQVAYEPETDDFKAQAEASDI